MDIQTTAATCRRWMSHPYDFLEPSLRGRNEAIAEWRPDHSIYL